MLPFICIDGTVGVGKTTFATALAKRLNYEMLEEPVIDNPFLPVYYKDVPRWSFATQIFFLNERFKLIQKAESLCETSSGVVLDRSIYGDKIFAEMLHKQGDMQKIELDCYHSLLDNMLQFVAKPKVMIFLDNTNVEHLRSNIEKRGRDYEQKVPIEYWQNLNKNYIEFMNNYDISYFIRLDVTDKDFVANPELLEEMLTTVEQHIKQLELTD